ncbi:NAD(P)H-dependent glycerol-3-phosphate dehydrogenase [Prosthecobacter dejongeii]|uniref:Glycerol-3-phosphate dehydrogenase [NAD(P)+] n=1 Tax=Prosthecobacter dejongeii TaxID=48465 RepID=A0A7W7YL08_9BACT|nr:NAD(P)H-dependent glycerol-3-phosphate dehydrogenase [Prosthecobacter dejongeii]MBB5038143.1 glycerol-3-phosphate dehydrogenase (NAD(P)+) [Prosthecobacter dejongeii]
MSSALPYSNALVIGAGSWGTALTAVLAERGMQVQFWGRDHGLMDEIQNTRRNSRYLPGLVLPASIQATAKLEELRPADLVVFVVPSKAVRETAHSMAALSELQTAKVIISCAKGIELNSGKRLTQILSESFPHTALAVLTGPNHAEEVSQRMATAAVVACEKENIAREVQTCFTLPWFRTYTSDDVAGVEWAGAMKNPYAIAAGIALGLKLGDNAIAALVTRALAEMVRMGVAMGGRPESFMGLGGVGDLMATCYSQHSRNHRVGRLIGEGMPLQEIMSSTRMVAEGVPNTASLHGAAKAKGVRTPLLDEIYSMLYEAKPAKEAMRALLSRDPRAETE